MSRILERWAASLLMATACAGLAAQQSSPPSPPGATRLTLADAERLALLHNPNISVARLLQLAQAQVARQVRSGELPTITGDLTAVDAHDNSRITAGLLNNPSV